MLPVYTTVAAVYQTESTASSSLLEVDELGRVVNLSPTIKALPGFVWVAHKSLMTDAPPDKGQASRNGRESRCDIG